MDKIKTYEELLNRALDSLRVATYYDYVNRREANKLYDEIKKTLSEPETDDGWISVEEEQPDSAAIDILMYGTDGKMTCGYYITGGWICDAPIGEVTHWQPLPEPPKGE